jgi:hypothetical protein
MKKLNLGYLLVFGFLTLQTLGCASVTLNKALDEKIAQEKNVDGRKGIQTEADQLIKNTSSLTPQQKKDLKTLGQSLSSQLDEISKESFKLRAVLIQDVISNYNSAEIDLIKDRLRKVEDRRLRLTFSTVEKANSILGRESARNNELSRDILFYYGMHNF